MESPVLPAAAAAGADGWALAGALAAGGGDGAGVGDAVGAGGVVGAGVCAMDSPVAARQMYAAIASDADFMTFPYW